MLEKIKRLSYNQLVLLEYFLKHADEILTVSKIEKHTVLEDKSLGGVLSSLSRTKFDGERLLEPLGKARDGSGLRWRLNASSMDIEKDRKEVRRLLLTY